MMRNSRYSLAPFHLALTIAILLVFCMGNARAVDLTLGGTKVDYLTWEPTRQYADHADLKAESQNQAAWTDAGYDVTFNRIGVNAYLDEDGNLITKRTLAWQYYTESGVRNYGSRNVYVDSFSQNLRILNAYTILPDGRTIDVDPATISLTVDSEDDIFTDLVIATLPFKEVVVGAISVVETETTTHAEKSLLPWSLRGYLQRSVPVEKFETSLNWHESQPMPAWNEDSSDVDCELSGSRSLVCAGENIDAFKGDDQINYADVVPTFTIAAPVSWNKLAQSVTGLIPYEGEASSVLSEFYADLTEGAETQRELLSRIHDFAARKVRYVGLEQGFGGLVPRPASLTLERRYGDCKDKALLFLELARLAGIKSWPVLTTFSRENLDKLEVPSSAYFDHMIVCGELDDGTEFCVDLTDPFARYDELPSALEEAVRLSLKDQTATPDKFPKRDIMWKVDIATDFIFQGDNKLVERQKRTYFGAYAAWYRSNLANRNRRERDNFLTDIYHESVTNSVNPTFSIEDLEDYNAPLIITSETVHDLRLNRENINFRVEEDWLHYEVDSYYELNKYNPTDIFGLEYSSQSTFKLKQGEYTTRTGPKIYLNNGYGKLEKNYQAYDGKVIVETELRVPSQQIPVTDAKAFHKYLSTVKDESTTRFWGKRPQS